MLTRITDGKPRGMKRKYRVKRVRAFAAQFKGIQCDVYGCCETASVEIPMNNSFSCHGVFLCIHHYVRGVMTGDKP